LYYQILTIIKGKNIYPDMWINVKRKVVAFIKEWCDIAKDAFYEDILIKQLLNVFIYVSVFNC
jgi:hypothetical protein